MNSKLTRVYFALVFAFLSAFSAQADEVDRFVRGVMAERNVPGVAIAVIKNGKTVKKQGYGVASVEFGAPVTTETVFEIGSVSKQMTGAAVMLLVEDGKINLDEKISAYLPNTPEAWKNVTVRNLLTHTSGIKSYTAIGTGFELSKRMKRDDFIKALSGYPLDFETGARYSYSNSGYNLLGFIIEAASGKSYWEFMQTRIFRKLGMAHTFDRDPKFVIKNRAVGYELENGQLIGRDYELTDIFAAGAIVSTVEDLIKWDAAWRSDTLLKKESKTEAWKAFILTDGKPYPYGFGWHVADFRGHRLIAHSGSTAGFNAQFSRFVDDDLSVIVLTNLGDAGYAGALARGIAKVYIPSISLKAMKPVIDGNPVLMQKFAYVLRDRLENRFSTDVMTENLIRALSTDRAKANHRRIAAFGAIRNFSLVGFENSGTTKTFRCRAETAKRLFLWRITLNADGKITEMTLEDEE